MKTINKILGTIGLFATLGLAGCKEFEIKYSPVLHEDAIVSYKNHVLPYSLGKFKSVESNGIETLQLTQINYPAKYEIAFDGKIRFELNDRVLFDRFHSNDQADVSYREKYSLIYDDTNNDGTNELVHKYFMDAEFIDAQPITNRILDRF